MVKCTEAFRMIILRLSETNCTECQATSLSSTVLKMWILLLLIQFGEIKMLKKKIQWKHIVETQERYKRQMSNRSNFVTYFYFVVLSYTTWLPEKHKEPKCSRSIYDKTHRHRHGTGYTPVIFDIAIIFFQFIWDCTSQD